MKKRVGSYKGKPIVELGGGGENILTKNELTTNSFGGSNKYKGEYYRVKEEYQKGYIEDGLNIVFSEGICSTESGTSIFNLSNVDDNRYRVHYVKYTVKGMYGIIFPTLKEYCIGALGSEDASNKILKELSIMTEPCTEEEYYSFFPKTINDIMK